MKKILVALVAVCAIAALVVAAGCSSTTKMRFTTGGEAGTYYAVGGVIAQHATNNVQDLEVTAVSSDGSKANVQLLQKKEAELAFCQSDVMAYAYNGTNVFAGEEAITNFRTVGALYMEQVQIVTCDPNIKTVADLKGKKVSVGAAGSGVYFNAVDILGAYGIGLDMNDESKNDIVPTYQSFGDSADSLKNGQIDAAFIVAGAPTSAITDLSAGRQAYLVALDDAHISTLVASNDYYTKNVIPAGTYKGIDTDTTTVAIGAVILVRDDMPEDAVYGLTADIFGNLDELAEAHAKFSEASIQFAASVTSVPYHAGAAKFFAEQGIEVATE